MSNCVVILAAGEGKRMKSGKPKALCEVLFSPMLDWVTNAAQRAGAGDICVVTGHLRQQLEDYIDGKYHCAAQDSQGYGTGYAVMCARDFLQGYKGQNVLVLCGDAPFIDAGTIKSSFEAHHNNQYAATVITANLEDPSGYGRIVRDNENNVAEIVEHKAADAGTLAIAEVNSGAYWFRVDALLDVLFSIQNNNQSNEYYLTDAIGLLVSRGMKVGAFTALSPDIVLGANDRAQLMELNRRMRKKILEKHLKNGVEIPCDDGIIIGPDVEIGPDTCVLPGTILKGEVSIGRDCQIGPNTLVENSKIGDRVKLNNTQCYLSTVDNDVKAGPFVHIRPNSHLKSHVYLGDFVEIKNSVMDEYAHVSHLTYVGDSDVGKHVNFGCGCVTVNYDGVSKNRCTIKDNVFLGCNTNLIAPVTVGENAYTAAGSTITEDVPDNALAVARERQVNKDEWVTKRNKKKGKK